MPKKKADLSGGSRAQRAGRDKAQGDSGSVAPLFEASPSLTAAPPDYRDGEALAGYLLDLLSRANRPLDMDALLRNGKLPRKAKRKMEDALYSLQEQGGILRVARGWSAPRKLRVIEGVLSVQRAGMGFVTPASGGPDIYIHPSALNDAWHGDSVEALILPGRKGPSGEGRIVRVLRRAQAEMTARALRKDRDERWICAPANPRIQTLFITDARPLEKPVREGDLLLVRPGEKAGPHLWSAVATANLELEESPAAQERIVKSDHAVPGPFPSPVLLEARALPGEPDKAGFEGRRDLRDKRFVTIDGRFARDFDDAILVEGHDGGYRLLVAIADVSHYVRPGSALDAEARLRGNSCYFPLSVEPMLPEALSNGLCSLRPDVPRLAVIADLLYTGDGIPRGAEFYPAVIVSKARLTYGQVERGLLLGEPEEEERLAPVLPMLRKAETLARLLMENRAGRGTLDFDLPETEIRFNEEENCILCIVPRQRHFGHRLIEEFMIAANEAVANFLATKKQPALYRVHQQPDPEKLQSLLRFLESAGLNGTSARTGRSGAGKDSARRAGKKAAPPSGRDLRRILAESVDTPHEYIVRRLLLRSMMQARYQTENIGHFGLASRCYCHFTSPIRRYADLAVHLSLKAALGLSGQAEKLPSEKRLQDIAERCNETERTAMEAEREILKRMTILYLRDKVGEEYDGVISGITDFGMFVELPAVMAEGMIRLSFLRDDYYEYLQERQELRGSHTGRTFRMGQTLRVKLWDVNLGRVEVSLIPADVPEGHFQEGGMPLAEREARRSALPRRSGQTARRSGEGREKTRAAKTPVRSRRAQSSPKNKGKSTGKKGGASRGGR